MPNYKSNLEELEQYIRSNDFAGYDPYDGLNSPLARLLSCGTKFGRIAFIQGFRRLPVNLRPLLGIEKGHNPKGIGLFLWGYSKLYRVDNAPALLPVIDHLLDLLDQLKSPGYAGNCWGYNFDWQNRKMFVPKWTPTIVNSSFIGHALLDCWEFTGKARAKALSLFIKDFIMNDLSRKKDGEAFCFSYSPIDNNYVHNANLLGASFLIRLYKVTGDISLRDTALNSLAYSMQHQLDDGSWFYAEQDGQRWIDSFHTGFNLQAIRYFLQFGEAEEYRQAYEKGVKFYSTNFFLQDGTPKYYHNNTYPIDIHAPAQAIVFFSGEGEEYQELTDRILNWTLSNMYDSKRLFYFRKGRWFTNKIRYMRWSQAWAFHALTEYCFQNKRVGN